MGIKMNFSITAKTSPECREFLKIKKEDTYYTIEKFIEKFHSDSDDILNDCFVWYRGTERSYQQTIAEFVAFAESLDFYTFQEPMLVINQSIQAAIYFANKASDCLQFARYFTINSALLLDTNYNLNWSQGYCSQYLVRCINFGTASTWYSNCFDHILQIVYWGLELYTSVTDRNGNTYNDSWSAKDTMGLCTYEFVVAELKKRRLKEIRKSLTSCSGKIEEVRMWANYIKHKGGVDYKYLEAEKPFRFYVMPIVEGQPLPPSPQIGDKFIEPDEHFLIKDFKSPVEIDIDEKLSMLKEAHSVLLKCLSEIVTSVDFDGHSVKMAIKEESAHE